MGQVLTLQARAAVVERQQKTIREQEEQWRGRDGEARTLQAEAERIRREEEQRRAERRLVSVDDLTLCRRYVVQSSLWHLRPALLEIWSAENIEHSDLDGSTISNELRHLPSRLWSSACDAALASTAAIVKSYIRLLLSEWRAQAPPAVERVTSSIAHVGTSIANSAEVLTFILLSNCTSTLVVKHWLPLSWSPRSSRISQTIPAGDV